MPSWAWMMSRAMARPSPVPPSSRALASSRRVKRSKMTARCSSGDPVAIVADGETDTIADLIEPDRDHGCGVPLGVVEQVANRSCELACVAEGLGGRHSPQVHLYPPPLTHAACLAKHDVIEVDGFEVGGGQAIIASRQLQQIVDEMLKIDGFARRHFVRWWTDRWVHQRRGRPRARCGSG